MSIWVPEDLISTFLSQNTNNKYHYSAILQIIYKITFSITYICNFLNAHMHTQHTEFLTDFC